MIAVIQRVIECSVYINESKYSDIEKGILVLVGIAHGDNDIDISYIGDKVLNLRIFSDLDGKMNKSLKDINGDVMLVSQFTLHADCKKGNRPSFIKAEKAEKAQEIYLRLLDYLQSKYDKVSSGSFQSFMKINLINDGPVTIIIDSNEK